MAQTGQWRWIFCSLRIIHSLSSESDVLCSDLNLPVCGVTFLMIFYFLLLPTPAGSMRENVVKMDWMCVRFMVCHDALNRNFRGNGLVISSTTALVIAITWGGVRFAWSSAKVLVPLVLGFVGLGIFMWYEFRFAPYPMVGAYRKALSGQANLVSYFRCPGNCCQIEPVSAGMHMQLAFLYMRG